MEKLVCPQGHSLSLLRPYGLPPLQLMGHAELKRKEHPMGCSLQWCHPHEAKFTDGGIMKVVSLSGQ